MVDRFGNRQATEPHLAYGRIPVLMHNYMLANTSAPRHRNWKLFFFLFPRLKYPSGIWDVDMMNMNEPGHPRRGGLFFLVELQLGNCYTIVVVARYRVTIKLLCSYVGII